MANTFKNKTFDGSSTAANSDMIPYTCPTSTTTVVIGLTIANTTSNQITVDIKLDASTNVFLAKNLPIPAGSAFEYMSGNKIIMQAGHSIKIQSDTANSADTTMSIMEIT
tara:strand:+ start:466 stop:795 length:330 start_codon:yes stop_codon:yes gene_type:complete